MESLIHADFHLGRMGTGKLDKTTAAISLRKDDEEETQKTSIKLCQPPGSCKNEFSDLIQALQKHICSRDEPYRVSDGVKTLHCLHTSNFQSLFHCFTQTHTKPTQEQAQISPKVFSLARESGPPFGECSVSFCNTISSAFSKFGSKISLPHVSIKCLQKPNVTVSKSCHFKKVKRNKSNLRPKLINSTISVQNKSVDSSKNFRFKCSEPKKCDLINDLNLTTVLFIDKFSCLKFGKHSSTSSKSPHSKLSCKKCSFGLSYKKSPFNWKCCLVSAKNNFMTDNSCVKIRCSNPLFANWFSESERQIFHETSVCKETQFPDRTDGVKFHCDILDGYKVRIDVQGGGHQYPRTCDKCHKSYSHKSSFHRHISSKSCERSINPEPKNQGSPKAKKQLSCSIVCPHCSKAYTTSSTYRNHFKTSCQSHKVSFIPCIESSCSIKFRSQLAMMRHLVEVHDKDLGVQKKTFSSMEEFEEWKRREEQQSFTALTKRRGEFLLGGKRSQYYSCMFNVQERRTFIRKRKPIKTPIENTYCPARIDLVLDSDEVKVTYYSYHNHELKPENLKFCRLDRKKRKFIDNLIENKVPLKKIKEELTANTANSESPHPSREDFITINQISRMKHLLAAKRKMSKEDALSVQLMMSVFYADKPGSILLYKPQGKQVEIGEDVAKHLAGHNLFVLGIQEERQRVEMINSCRKVFCIDVNCFPKMCDFYLINLLVQDEFNEGYPVAHFITSRIDPNVLTAIFSTLKSKCPDIEINAFITNDNPSLYNTFAQVFENKPVHFLCKSHLKVSWLNQLNEKVDNSQLVSEIFSCLEALVEESSYEAFQEMLSNFLDKYQSLCPDFWEHFSTHYAKKPDSWAMCFRNLPYAAADSSEFCAFFHKKLKSACVSKKTNLKVSDLIAILSEVDSNFHLALAYKRFTNEVPVNEANESHCRHWRGMSISDGDVTPVGKFKFRVKSQSKSDICYSVKVVSARCSAPNVCHIQCRKSPCHPLCCHMYVCSCQDTSALCKHIHKVHILSKSKNSSNPLEKSKDESDESDDDLNSSGVLKKRIPPPEPSENERLVSSTQKTLSELQALLADPKIQPLSHHISETVKSLVSECNGLLSGKQVTKNPSGSLPAPPPSSDHTYIDPTKRAKIQSNMQRPTTKIVIAERVAKPVTPEPKKKTVIRIPLESLEQSRNFFGTLQPTDSLTKVLFKYGQYGVKLYHLKSLDANLPDKDLARIQSEVPDFKKGMLYDCIIFSYLVKIAEPFPFVKIIDPSVSQILANFKRDVLVMIPIAEFEKIIIPCNPDDTHWLLLVVYPKLKLVHFFDPECAIVKQCYRKFIARWVRVMSKNSGIPVGEWKIRAPMHVCQSDSLNCGVFVTWYADQILKNLSTVSTFSVEIYRRQMYRTLKALVPNNAS